jgi:rhodanese-related sulfurtransferase
VKHLSVTETHGALASGGTYLDVRSTREFAEGHPAGAINIPLIEPDEDSGTMLPNPDFIRVAQAVLPADVVLFVGCQAGGRSMRAAQMLESFGFSDVTNVRGGFGGAADPSGRVEPGWATAGLPVETGAPAERRYSDLLAQADAAE